LTILKIFWIFETYKIHLCTLFERKIFMEIYALKFLLFVLALVGGDLLTKFMKWLLKIELESELGGEKSSSMKLSAAIGYLERALIFLLTLRGHPEAIGWIFAAKSIARFRELESRRFTEYYLIGTLTSIFWALLCGTGASNLPLHFQ